ncbi:MAG: response regulator transcription factor [Ruminococcus sp.]|nr:response regulator transcription factor [Ruminococcus sp.]
MIYMLEDEAGIRNFVLYALNNSGFDAMGFELPSQLREAMEVRLPDLLLLDIMLPEEDGISVLKKLRSSRRTKNLPIILLTAKGTEFDKVAGLDSGADDYIAKPFGTMELISRIKALLRRTSAEAAADITCDGIAVDTEKRRVTANGSDVNLTRKEYELLLTLIRGKGKVFTRDELLHNVWEFDYSGESRTVDVHIRTLRAKLGSCGDIIETIRGVGYKVGTKHD